MLNGYFNYAALRRLEGGLSLIEVTRDAPDALVGQLVGRDRVHSQGTESIESLREFRLGGPSFNRRCFALASEESGKICAVINAHAQTRAIESSAKIPGKLGSILLTPARALDDRPVSCIQFYSISAFDGAPKGAGKTLIGAVHAHLKEDDRTANAYKTTLSPLRSFPFPETGNFVGQKIGEKRWHAMIHLLQGTDPVQRFHMGNGATIGLVVAKADINFFNNPMVEYHYSDNSAELLSNAKSFRKAVAAYDAHKDNTESCEFKRARDDMNAVVHAAMAKHLQRKLPPYIKSNHPDPAGLQGSYTSGVVLG
jgi:hypothetical protein